jgi:NAD(P)-dependent dehydrogenase (short-subunit alcohol dehydrogenase family)
MIRQRVQHFPTVPQFSTHDAPMILNDDKKSHRLQPRPAVSRAAPHVVSLLLALFAVVKRRAVTLYSNLPRFISSMSDVPHSIHSAPPADAPLCLVAGVGPGIGAAVVRKFASQGFVVLMLARSEAYLTTLSASLLSLSPPSFAFPFPCDLTSSASLTSAFSLIAERFPSSPLSVFIFNAGQRRLRAQRIESISVEEMQQLMAVNALSFHSLLTRVLPLMKATGRGGTVIVTSATGAVRSSPGFASFSASKWALRAMVGCLAKEAVNDRIHVVHVIVDAVVDTPLLRGYLEKKRSTESREEEEKQQQTAGEETKQEAEESRASALKGPLSVGAGRRYADIVMASPEAIADTYWWLHCQHETAWTLELDLHPYNESLTARL